MAADPSTNAPNSELSAEERARIRAEMRYAMVVAAEARAPQKQSAPLDRALTFMSNGFVLLLVGSIITSFLVPRFQRAYEDRAREAALKQECLTQFLLYSTSMWQEYYSILPLTLQPDLDRDEYVRHLNDISQIKLKRYEAFSTVQALALVFRDSQGSKSQVELALWEYAVRVNEVSQAIDSWLRNLYCTPTKRDKSPCATFDPTFDAYDAYLNIQQLVVQLGNQGTRQVTDLMVNSIKSR